MPLDQLIIAITGVSAAWILNGPEGPARRYACLIGLAGQPFWFWSTWTHGQWGMFIVTAGFTLAYLRGLWTLWLRPRFNGKFHLDALSAISVFIVGTVFAGALAALMAIGNVQ